MNEQDGSDTLTVQRWTSRIAKMAQPDLDFIGIKQSNSSCPFVFKYSTLMKCFCFHSFLLLFCLSFQHQLSFIFWSTELSVCVCVCVGYWGDKNEIGK